MSEALIPHGDFINITGAPNLGRDARRTHVRRTVMTNYHKRRLEREKYPFSKCETNRSLISTQATQLRPSNQIPPFIKARPGNAPSFPPQACGLLHPKPWIDLDHARTSHIITRFLQGQVTKVIQNICCVSFIHHRVFQAQDQPHDPLFICRELFRIHYDPATSQPRDTLWDEISKAQESIYEKACFTSSLIRPVDFDTSSPDLILCSMTNSPSGSCSLLFRP